MPTEESVPEHPSGPDRAPTDKAGPATDPPGGRLEQKPESAVPPTLPADSAGRCKPPQNMALFEVTALLSELRVLLRHIVRSEVPDARALSGNQTGAAGPDAGSVPFPQGVHVELLTKTPEETAADDALLQQLYSSIRILAALAAPATVTSICLTSAFLHDEMSPIASFEARSAAQRLIRWALITGLLGLLLFAVTLMLMVHVDRGRSEMQQLDYVRNEYQLVVGAIDQTHNPNLIADCLKGSPGPGASDAQPGVNQQPICERLREAFEKIQITRGELASWNAATHRLSYLIPMPGLGKPGAQPAGLSEVQSVSSELQASTEMAGLTGFVLPMLLGTLGAFTYVYRDLDRRVRAATLRPGDGLHGTLRMLLGTILGGLLGLLWTSDQPIKVEGVTLSLTALAFFVGYSVEVVFQVLDSIVTKVAGTIQK